MRCPPLWPPLLCLWLPLSEGCRLPLAREGAGCGDEESETEGVDSDGGAAAAPAAVCGCGRTVDGCGLIALRETAVPSECCSTAVTSASCSNAFTPSSPSRATGEEEETADEDEDGGAGEAERLLLLSGKHALAALLSVSASVGVAALTTAAGREGYESVPGSWLSVRGAREEEEDSATADECGCAESASCGGCGLWTWKRDRDAEETELDESTEAGKGDC